MPASSPPAPTRRKHPRGRGRQGDREHAARSEHCPRQRTGDHLQQDGHRYRCRSESRRHQVEFPALPARAGRRALHWRGPLLPDP